MTDLEAFIARHAKPYDPATDDYRRPPFASPVKAGKNSPIYNAHSYHTKVPPEGIVPYIEHYTDPGDLVLDPFCGSGMTGVAALMTGRNAVLNDLSPAAVHIARNYCTPVDVAALRREFERIKAAVKDEFDWLYGTTCDRCGGPATIQYTVWSDVFACGRCGGEIVLWDVAVDRDAGKVCELFTCPHCDKEQKKLGLRRLPATPVLTAYNCQFCKPKRSVHPTTQQEKVRVAEIEVKEIPYWVPDTEFDTDGPQYRRSALSSRTIRKVADLYTKRNLWGLSRLWYESDVSDTFNVSSNLRFALTAGMGVASRRNRWPQQQTMSGTIYIPSLSIEMNVFEQFQRRCSSLLDAPPSNTWLSRHSRAETARSSATQLPLSNCCIDYIFTDPPFGSSIYYSEMNLLWEAWLEEITDTEHEAVVHRKQDGGTKRLPDYARLMGDSFREMYRVLKPGRWASVVFHNSDDLIWQAILDAAEAVGFEVADVNAFDKEQLTFKGIKGAKGEERVTNKDIVLNLRKPAPHDAVRSNGRAPRDEAERRVIERVADFLAAGPPPAERTLQHLWNHVLVDMLRAGSVDLSMADVEKLLAAHYQSLKLIDGRYYLRGEAVAGGNVFDLRSDAGAIEWLRNVLANEPQTIGDLIPKWQQETAYLGGVEPGRLERLLEQNFWQDRRSGRWRLPSAAEREKLLASADLKAEAHLRVVQRFLDGALERRPSDAELAAWVRFCYSREHFAEATRLFQQINQSALDPEEYRVVKKMAAVSRVRAGQD
jgi:DNA modification methylase